MDKMCYIMVGVSGAGKSSYVLELLDREDDAGRSCRVFSLDLVRLSFYSWFMPNVEANYAAAFTYANEHPKEFDQAVRDAWQDALSSSDTVIVDNTNLSRKSRVRWIQEARVKGFKIHGVEVNAPLSVVIARQATRGDKSVPENVVRDMYLRQQSLLLGSEVDFFTSIDGTK